MNIALRFPLDNLWIEKKKPLDFRIEYSETRSDSNQVKELRVLAHHTPEKQDSQNLMKYLERSTIAGYKRLVDLNQVGIKDYVFPKASRVKHNRLNHSIGSSIVGTIWYKVLEASGALKNTQYSVLSSNERISRILTLSLMLHDIGHLPYCHLTEEIFHELRWTLGSGRAFRHDGEFSATDKDTLKQTLTDIFGSEQSNEHLRLVERLVGGVSGIPFLDAIVNGPLDADKIDYVFRDMKYMPYNQNISERDVWLKDFLSDLELTKSGLICLNGRSAERSLELLQTRMRLYFQFYLSPKMRVLERIAAIIIISWFTDGIAGVTLDNLKIQNDLSQVKGNAASKLLLEGFDEQRDEFDLLISICKNLASGNTQHGSLRDKASRDWFGELVDFLQSIYTPEDDHSLSDTTSNLERCIIGDTFFVEEKDFHRLERIIRDIHINYPCSVMIDFAVYPRFLSYPIGRNYTLNGVPIMGEQFLVPKEPVSNWNSRSEAIVPLSSVDLRQFDIKKGRVTVFNPLQRSAGKDAFIFDLLIGRCNKEGIEISYWLKGM